MEPEKNEETSPTTEHKEEPKKFLNRFEIIEAIKELDDSIVNVSLNLIKCDFNASENDVRKAYPDFKFLKVKNYHPGSFEIVLPLRIDAINFVKNSKDIYILSRKPIIKMGRNFPPNDQDWTFVEGNPHGRHHGRRNYGGDHHRERKNFKEGPDAKEEGDRKPQDRKPTKTEPTEKPSTTPTQQPKPRVLEAPRVIEVPKSEVKPQPKVEQVPKPPAKQQKSPVKSQQPSEYKPIGFTSAKTANKTEAVKTEKVETKPVQPAEQPKQPEQKPAPKVEVKPQAKKVEPVKQPEPKPAPKQQQKQQPKQVEKRQQQKQPEPEPPKEEDDGWHFVVDKKAPKKKK